MIAVDPLIREAKERQRRRRLAVGAVVLAAAAGGGGWLAGRGGSSSPSPQAVAAARAEIAAVARRAPITESGLTGGIGWAMDGYGLWLTPDGGRRWLASTPKHVRTIGDPVARINQIQFVDRRHGWLSASDVFGGFPLPKNAPSWRHMEVDRTTDGGRTWQAFVPPGCLQSCGGVDLDFLDASRGYAIAPHDFFSTDDGGATWTRVSTPPFSGQILFLDARRGFGVSNPSHWGGPEYGIPLGGGIPYRTANGGRTWRRVALAAPAAYDGWERVAGPVSFFGVEGVLPVRFRRGHVQRLVVYLSRDGGATWAARSVPETVLPQRLQWGFPLTQRFAAATATDWVLVAGYVLHATTDAGRHWRTVHPLDLPAGATFWEAHFTSALHGWAIVSWPQLQGAVLVQTQDGGRWWTPLAPPVPRPKPAPKPRPVCSSSCYRP